MLINPYTESLNMIYTSTDLKIYIVSTSENVEKEYRDYLRILYSPDDADVRISLYYPKYLYDDTEYKLPNNIVEKIYFILCSTSNYNENLEYTTESNISNWKFGLLQLKDEFIDIDTNLAMPDYYLLNK